MSNELTFFSQVTNGPEQPINPEKALSQLLPEISKMLNSLERTLNGSLIPVIEKKGSTADYLKNYQDISANIANAAQDIQELSDTVAGHAVDLKSR